MCVYNHRLDTFLKVAELGGFSRAAAALYITPSAVIQQIGQLEKELGARLFERSTHGVRLTQSGRLLQEHALRMAQEDRELREKLLALQQPTQEQIVVLTDFLCKPRLFSRLWKQYAPEGVAIEMRQLLDLREDSEKVDLIEFVQDGELWQRKMDFHRVCDMPIVLAMPNGHPLCERECVTMQELRGETLITIRKGRSQTLDDFALEAASCGAQVIEVDAYNMSVFSRCDVEGVLLQIPQCWGDLYEGFKTVSGTWPHKLPYGFFTRPNCSPVLKEFIRYAKESTRA